MKPRITKRPEKDIQKTVEEMSINALKMGFRPVKYYCEGFGVKGGGETAKQAYENWELSMFLEGKGDQIPKKQFQNKTSLIDKIMNVFKGA